MALVFVDGFDSAASGAVATEMAAAGWSTTSNIVQATGRVAGYAIMGQGIDGAPTYVMASTSAAYTGFAVRALVSSTYTLLSFRDTTDSGNGPLTISYRNGGMLVTLVGGVTVSNSAMGILPSDNVYRHVQVSLNSSNVGGSYKVLVESVTVLQATGIDTAVSTAGVLRSIVFVAPQAGGLDDVYIGNAAGPAPYNALLGDCRVETIRPTSDSAVAWVPSTTTASNALLVADVSTCIGTYVQTSVTAARDAYVMGNLASTPAAVYAVVPQMYHQKLDAGALDVRPYLEVSGVTAVGTAVGPLVSTLRWTQEIFTTQPSGAAWTPTAVNNLICGFEAV